MTIKQPDWEAIQRAYRAGSLSVRSIGEQHSVNHATILKRAKKEGWTRDLTEQVRTATKQKVTSAVTTAGNQSPVVTDAEIIDEASDQAAAVVLAHRAGLAKWRAIADKLSDALSDMDVVAENLGDISRALNAGVDAQLKVIKGERQAYNLDTEESDKTVSGLSDLMDELSKDA
jgi:predicted  nucleic acid-binding Zn-ribbon protein